MLGRALRGGRGRAPSPVGLSAVDGGPMALGLAGSHEVRVKHLGHVLSVEGSVMKPHPGSPHPEKLGQYLRERLRELMRP